MTLYDIIKLEMSHYDLGIFSKEEQERRISICQSCENFQEAEHKCNICNCPINWAVMFTRNSCPAGKWTPTLDK